MGLPNQSIETLRPLSEEELSEWEEAYAAVEAYLQALRLRNRLLVAELVRGILARASERQRNEPLFGGRAREGARVPRTTVRSSRGSISRTREPWSDAFSSPATSRPSRRRSCNDPRSAIRHSSHAM